MIDRYKLSRIVIAGLGCCGAALAQTAPAGPSGPARLRGTIEAASDTDLTLATRSGDTVHIVLPAVLRSTYVVAARLSDIQPDSYIGTAAVRQPDGTLKALEVHVFPPSMRGSGEGSRPYDLEGGSTMTNGTVASLVGTSGRVATVRYAAGEKQVLIPEDVPVVMFEPTGRTALKVGAKVVINARRADDGVVTAVSVNIGKDGLMPPM